MSLILVAILESEKSGPWICRIRQHKVKSVLTSELSVTVSKELNLYSVQGNTNLKY